MGLYQCQRPQILETLGTLDRTTRRRYVVTNPWAPSGDEQRQQNLGSTPDRVGIRYVPLGLQAGASLEPEKDRLSGIHHAGSVLLLPTVVKQRTFGANCGLDC